MTGAQMRQLDEQGYVTLPGFIDEERLCQLRRQIEELYEADGENAGCELRSDPFARQLTNLVERAEVFEEVLGDPRVIVFLSHILDGSFKLSSLTARSANPYSPEAQPMHTDLGLLPDENGPRVAIVAWLLDDFTCENGATRLVPGSHLWGRRPQDVPMNPKARHPQEIVVTAPAGSLLIYNAHLWHSGSANHTSRHRRVIHASYVRRDVPQKEWQKRALSEQTQQRLTPLSRYLLALDDPLNDALCQGRAAVAAAC